MNAWMALDWELRVGILAILGLAAGAAVNLGTYRLAWNGRHVSPWLRPVELRHPDWRTRLPVLGWLLMRGESHRHGAWFWVRPLVVELGLALALVLLYGWEIGELGLIPLPLRREPQALLAAHYQFAAHAVLLVLMLVASLIDLDEKTIPDAITLPGTLLGLVLAAWLPQTALPIEKLLDGGRLGLDFLTAVSPAPWPRQLAGSPQWSALALACGCYWGWCLAILPRVWRPQRGWRLAWRIFGAHLARDPLTRLVGLLALLGPPLVALVWSWGGAAWQGLLTALIGMAASGGLIWAVRLIGAAVLSREAMGFGDVTLMAMLGAFLGWQPCLLVFFLSPFCGLVLGAIQWLMHGDAEIPFGPFLCLAALWVVVRWDHWWQWSVGLFSLGWVVPLVVLVCLGLLAALLAGLQVIRGAWRN